MAYRAAPACRSLVVLAFSLHDRGCAPIIQYEREPQT